MPQVVLRGRLRAAYDLLPEDTLRLIDVGCDHGYLSAFFLENHPEGKALLIDKREGPLAKAALATSPYEKSGRATLSLSDGLSVWHPEAQDTVVIAGMGGREILSILRQTLDLVLVPEDYTLRLVWQAMRDVALVREMFRLAGAEAGEQKLVEDRGWVYSADTAVFTKDALVKLQNSDNKDSTGGEVEDWLGPIFGEGGLGPIFGEGEMGAALADNYCRRQIRIARGEIAGLNGEKKLRREALVEELARNLAGGE